MGDKKIPTFGVGSVASPGLEPGQTEPESAVLPLHNKAKKRLNNAVGSPLLYVLQKKIKIFYIL